MATDHVKAERAKTFRSETATKPSDQGPELLWGDQVQTMEVAGARTRIKARGEGGGLRGYDDRELWIDTDDLGGEPLLEVYFIDVGQGDGVLVVTPDRKHLLVDGGAKRDKQPTGKNAADFVDWKFYRDYRKPRIELDAMVVSHLDADHFGGLTDLLDPTQRDDGSPERRPMLDVSDVRVERVYHPGLTHWTDVFGPTAPATDGGKDVFTRLLGDRNHVRRSLDPTTTPRLRGESSVFWKGVVDARNKAGNVTTVKRLDGGSGHLDGFGPSDDVSIKVLGPLLAPFAQGKGLRKLGSEGESTNGNSVVLRLDYDRARILLTGDLNKKAQGEILTSLGSATPELACDVAKACHHGSSDVDFRFLAAMRAGATVISSGDSEGYGHPQPDIVAASSVTGNATFTTSGDLRTPLVFSTEIARSVGLGRITGLADRSGKSVTTGAVGDLLATYQQIQVGDLNASTKTVSLRNAYLAAGIVYGLVNVRTDGRKVLCATRDEKTRTWDVATFPARFT